jgi:hypothetical protein
MMRIKKRAYLATLAILAALGGMAYYANSQSKKFELNMEAQDGSLNLKKPAPTPSPVPVPLPVPVPNTQAPVSQTPPSQPEKSKTFIIELDQYSTKTNQIKIPKGYTTNLVIKTDSYRSGDGLSFHAPGEFPTLILPGQSKTLTYKPESTFDLEVYLGKSTVKAPYKIIVLVE